MTQEDAATFLCAVIVPVYNGRETILNCLAALARQTLPLHQFQVIIVDDGSTDGTVEAVTAWINERSLPNWHVISQKNAGPATARNHGASVAVAPILLFTDADCTPSNDWVESMIQPFLNSDPPAAVMGCYLSQQTEPAARFAQYEFEERYALMARRRHIDLVATYAAAYAQEIFWRFGGFDTSFPKANNEDVEFSYRLSRDGLRMIFLSGATVTHPHTSTWSRYFKTKWERAYWRTQVYRHYPEKAVADSYTPQTLKVQMLFGLPALLGLAVAGITGSWYWLLPTLLFFAAVMPTLLFMSRRSPSFVLWALWGLWLRSLAFTGGVAWGILRPYTILATNNDKTNAATLTSYE